MKTVRPCQVLLGLALQGVLAAPAWAADPCSPAQTAEILASATADQRAVAVSCNLRLKADDVVTKAMRIEASNVTLDCRGATLDGGPAMINEGKDILVIRSIQAAKGWQRPENVEVKNCNIVGSMRIYGMAVNGEGTLLRDSSRKAAHVERAQAAAPRRIMLRNLLITGTGRVPLYLSPGVSEVTLRDSEMRGVSNSAAIYLDTESMNNVILSNKIAVDTRRELIAVDGSSHNLIRDNDFYELADGGIFLYRNCGEGGTIRHSTPSYNSILDNRFHYARTEADKPAIHIGSRDGNRRYCTLDDGYDFGSSKDNRDFARHNVVVGNKFIELLGGTPIRVGGESNQPNDIQQP